MTNVCLNGSIVIFRDEAAGVDDTPGTSSPDYLLGREMAERAAAENSETQAARRIHQELAEMYGKQRQPEGAPGHG